jgi:cholesterol transport system auxiliary component
VTSALLDQMPLDIPQGTRSPTTLIVFPPDARPALDGTPMAYTLRAHHLAYFAHHRWAESPPQMLQPLLLRTLEATGAFAAVVPPPHRTAGAQGLRVEIAELVQDFSQEPPVLRLAVRARLSDEAANRVIATREFRVQEPMQQKAPAAGVVAANAAVARMLAELARWVLDNAR